MGLIPRRETEGAQSERLKEGRVGQLLEASQDQQNPRLHVMCQDVKFLDCNTDYYNYVAQIVHMELRYVQ